MVMFEGTVERISHEGGLMVPFTGASPALGSILVDEGGAYVGKVDAVLGTTDAPVVHLAHLDRKRDPESLIGATLAIRARADRQGGRGGDERRGGRFDRGNDRRGGDRDQRGGGDWTCPQCSNSNFSFRTECNRCSAPRGDTPGDECGRQGRGRDERRGGRFDRGNDRRGGDRDQRRSPIYVEWGDANQIERILDAAFWKPGLEEVEQLHRTIAPSFLEHVLQQPCVGGKAAALQLWQVAGCPKPEDDQPEVWGYVLATSHARLGDAEQDIRKRLEEVERLKKFSEGRLYEGALQVEPRLLQRSEGLHAAGGSSLAFAMNILDVLGPLGIEAHPVLIDHLLMGIRTVRETARLLDAYGGNKELIRRVTEEGEDEMAVAVELGLYQF